MRERLLLRPLVQDTDVRQILLPRLTGYTTVRSLSTWPLIEAIDALMAADPAFNYSLLESRLSDDLKTLLHSALFADHSGELLAPEQAETFLTMVESDDRELQYRQVQRDLLTAERQGNLEEAMRLMQVAGELKRRIRSGPA